MFGPAFPSRIIEHEITTFENHSRSEEFPQPLESCLQAVCEYQQCTTRLKAELQTYSTSCPSTTGTPFMNVNR